MVVYAMSGVRVVLLGPPGSGKGTQARLLAEKLGLNFIVASSVITETLPTLPKWRRERYEKMRNKGVILPPGIVAKWLADRLNIVLGRGQGVILDGSPRSVKEARHLEKYGVDWSTFKVIFIRISDDVSLKRMRNRRECARCRKPVPNFPEYVNETQCRQCGGALIRREHETEESLQTRIRTYHKETEPVISYFQERGVLTEVSGERSIDEVFVSITAILGGR